MKTDSLPKEKILPNFLKTIWFYIKYGKFKKINNTRAIAYISKKQRTNIL